MNQIALSYIQCDVLQVGGAAVEGSGLMNSTGWLCIEVSLLQFLRQICKLRMLPTEMFSIVHTAHYKHTKDCINLLHPLSL